MSQHRAVSTVDSVPDRTSKNTLPGSPDRLLDVLSHNHPYVTPVREGGLDVVMAVMKGEDRSGRRWVNWFAQGHVVGQ